MLLNKLVSATLTHQGAEPFTINGAALGVDEAHSPRNDCLENPVASDQYKKAQTLVRLAFQTELKAWFRVIQARTMLASKDEFKLKFKLNLN